MKATIIGLLFLLGACAAPGPTEDGQGQESEEMRQPAEITGDEQADARTVQDLEARARALANAEGCEDAGGCQAAPLGAKACGGPREYIAYCAETTDTAALNRALAELGEFEDAYNQRYGIVSDCMLVTEPPVTLENGVCRAEGGAGMQIDEMPPTS